MRLAGRLGRLSGERRVRVQVPGKLMLLGEYAVLEGAPALVAAVDAYAHVEVAAASAFSLMMQGPAVEKKQVDFVTNAAGEADFSASATAAGAGANGLGLGPAARAIAAACAWTREVGCAMPPAQIYVDTRAFSLPGGDKLGLGSSAAVVVGVLLALAAHAGVPEAMAFDGGEAACAALFGRAHAAHAGAQGGRGSGADVAASVMGGVVLLRAAPGKPPVLRRLPDAAPVAWQAVYSGRGASTAAFLAQVANLKVAQPDLYWRIYERLGVLSQAGAEFWMLGDSNAFLSVIGSVQEALAELGRAAGADIVTAVHAQLQALVQTQGGVYKISGAGGGDIGLAWCRRGLGRRRIARALASFGAAPLPLRLARRGATVWVG